MSDENISVVDEQQPPEQKETSTQHLKIKEKLANLPSDIDKAIEEGKGNDVIDNIQSLLTDLITSVFESCRLASLKLLMLTDKQRKQMSKQIYIFGVICSGFILLSLLFNFKIETIVFALVIIIGAYLADLTVQAAVLKPKKKPATRKKASSKQKTNTTDDDIL